MSARFGRKKWKYNPSRRERTAFHEAGHCVALFHVGFDLSTASIRRKKDVLGWVRMSRSRCGPLMDELGRTRRGQKQICDLEMAVALSGMMAEYTRGLWAGENLPNGFTMGDLALKHGATADWVKALGFAGLKRDPPKDISPHDPDLGRLNLMVARHAISSTKRIFFHDQYKAGMIAVARALLARTTLSSSQVRGILQRAMARHGGPPPGHGALRMLVDKARAQRRGRRQRRLRALEAGR
jgi:hypothetical protein